MKTIQNSLWDKQRPKLVLYTLGPCIWVSTEGQQEERRHQAFLRCSNHENFKAGFNSQSIRNIAKCRDNDISLRSMWLANRAVTIVLTNRSARTDNYNDDHSGISYRGNGKCLSWPFLQFLSTIIIKETKVLELQGL